MVTTDGATLVLVLGIVVVGSSSSVVLALAVMSAVGAEDIAKVTISEASSTDIGSSVKLS